MSFAKNDPSLGWHDIEEHMLTLRGVGHPQPDAAPASITFVARSVLSRPDSIHSPSAIAFDTTINIPHTVNNEPIQIRRSNGNYGSLVEQRAALAALRNGTENEAQFSMEGLDLHIYQHEWGARSALCVEGVASTILKPSLWPWPMRAHKIGDWLLNDNLSAYCLRFAFLTSLVDPPHIDSFIQDIDSLLFHLRQFADP